MLEIETTTILLLVASGAFAGFSAGLLGIGGGLIIVPALYFILALDTNAAQDNLMHVALATSLATIIVTSISSTIAHQRRRAIAWSNVLLLTPGLVVGAWFGADLASALDSAVLKPVFGLFEIFVAFLMFTRYQSRQHDSTIRAHNALLGGSIIGCISAIVGIGGGTLTVPFLHWHKVPIKNAIATSAACGFPIALTATASYVYNSLTLDNLSGFVDLHAFTIIAICSFIFAPAGAYFAHSIRDDHLKKIFAVFLLFLGIRMLAG